MAVHGVMRSHRRRCSATHVMRLQNKSMRPLADRHDFVAARPGILTAFSFGRALADRPASRCVSRLHAFGARSSRLRDTPAPVHARRSRARWLRGRFAQPCGPRSRGTAALALPSARTHPTPAPEPSSRSALACARAASGHACPCTRTAKPCALAVGAAFGVVKKETCSLRQSACTITRRARTVFCAGESCAPRGRPRRSPKTRVVRCEHLDASS